MATHDATALFDNARVGSIGLGTVLLVKEPERGRDMSRVLIVEDEEGERKTLSRVLELEGFKVDAAATADQALATLAVETIDVALIDVMMPGLSGIALARMIADRHAAVNLVLISAFHLSGRQLERLDIPRVQFVDKPLEIPALVSLLRSLPTASA